jgi:hypothetical protein
LFALFKGSYNVSARLYRLEVREYTRRKTSFVEGDDAVACDKQKLMRL